MVQDLAAEEAAEDLAAEDPNPTVKHNFLLFKREHKSQIVRGCSFYLNL
jgi:hypothetical protein